MLPLALFRRPAFTGVQLAAFAISASAFALFLYIGLYLQNYLGYTPLQAGLRYLPITLAAFFMSPVAAALLSRVPARALMSAGLALSGAGLLLMSGIRRRLRVDHAARRLPGPGCAVSACSTR